MKIHIHELAAKEFDKTIQWYEHQSEGLGERLKKTALAQIEKIKKNPNWFWIEAKNI